MSDLNSITQPLDPILGVNSSTIAITAAVTGVALPQLPDNGQPANNAFQFDIYNTNSTAIAIAFAATSAAAVTAAVVPSGATPAAYVIGPGERRTLTVRGKPQFVAAAGTITTAVYVTPGNGRA